MKVFRLLSLRYRDLVVFGGWSIIYFGTVFRDFIRCFHMLICTVLCVRVCTGSFLSPTAAQIVVWYTLSR